jgi:hypothetical protein
MTIPEHFEWGMGDVATFVTFEVYCREYRLTNGAKTIANFGLRIAKWTKWPQDAQTTPGF